MASGTAGQTAPPVSGKLTPRLGDSAYRQGGRERATMNEAKRKHTIEAVAIGASAGGFEALNTLLSPLPGDFPLPLLIAQHLHAAITATLIAQATSRPLRGRNEGMARYKERPV